MIAPIYRAYLVNETKLAQKYYMMAAVLDPSDVEPLFSTAQLELNSVTSRDAMAIIASAYKKFKMVKEINPNYPKISYFMARCHFEIGEFDKAIEVIINGGRYFSVGIAKIAQEYFTDN